MELNKKISRLFENIGFIKFNYDNDVLSDYRIQLRCECSKLLSKTLVKEISNHYLTIFDPDMIEVKIEKTLTIIEFYKDIDLENRKVQRFEFFNEDLINLLINESRNISINKIIE